MKHGVIATILAVLVLLVGVFLLNAQTRVGPATDKNDKRTINTSGSATIRVKPDSARVFFGVQTLAGTIKEARADNAMKVKKVMDELLQLKIPDLKMKSSDVQVELVQSRQTEDKLPHTVGFRITSTFTVLVQNDDSEKLGVAASKILDCALENGANMVQQIVFFKKDFTEIKRQALTKAVEDATANARALAAGAKANVAEIITINGQPEYSWLGSRQDLANTIPSSLAVGGETPLVVGELEVTCHVGVVCAF